MAAKEAAARWVADAMRFGDSVLQTGYEIRQAVESFIQRQNVEGIVQARCSIL